jgi:hypothetical protein
MWKIPLTWKIKHIWTRGLISNDKILYLRLSLKNVSAVGDECESISSSDGDDYHGCHT